MVKRRRSRIRFLQQNTICYTTKKLIYRKRRYMNIYIYKELHGKCRREYQLKATDGLHVTFCNIATERRVLNIK